MATFSTNQNRNLYVAGALGVSSHKPSLSNAGDIGVYHVGDGKDKQLYFLYKGKNGDVIKSDYIPVENIDYVKAVKATVSPLKEVEVTCASTINSGAPVAGQDYILRIAFRQFYGMSDEDQYFKDIAVHVTDAMEATPSLFYTALANAANAAFSREIGATKTTNPYLTFTAASTKLTIMEKEQEWTLGVGSVQRVYFEVQPTTIYTGGDDVIWGTVTDVTAANTTVGTDALGNGKNIADLEWFCMGERGDQYRYMGYPNYIPTDYMVDPTKQYSAIEIHYAFTDTGVNSYRSEKDITIVVADGAAGHVYDVINAIVDEIEYHSGLTIAGLS